MIVWEKKIVLLPGIVYHQYVNNVLYVGSCCSVAKCSQCHDVLTVINTKRVATSVITQQLYYLNSNSS